MTTRNAAAVTDNTRTGVVADPYDSKTRVSLLAYTALILLNTQLRDIVEGQVNAIKAARDAGQDVAPVRVAAVANVTNALKTWGFSPATIDLVAAGQLTTEENLYQAVPNKPPDSYSLTGCSAGNVGPGLALLD